MNVNRRGFSFMGPLTTLAVLGVVANVALPVTRFAKRWAEGARVVADVRAVRSALATYAADHDRFPPSSALGSVPEGLESYLLDGLAFDRGGNRYGWINHTDGSEQLRFLFVWGPEPRLIEHVADSYAGRAAQWGGIAVLYVDHEKGGRTGR